MNPQAATDLGLLMLIAGLALLAIDAYSRHRREKRRQEKMKQVTYSLDLLSFQMNDRCELYWRNELRYQRDKLLGEVYENYSSFPSHVLEDERSSDV